MSKIRRLLVPALVAWLILHVMVIAGTSALLLESEADFTCTCVHGAEDGTCPMHGKLADSARCRLQRTQNDPGLALLSMLGPLTLPVATGDVVAIISLPAPRGYDDALPLDWTDPPDAPPPRS